MLKRLIAVAMVVVALAVPASAASAAGGKNIVETAAGNPQFSTLVSLVEKAGLAETLAGKGPYTVFAPTNAAFAKVPKKTLNMLASNKAMLKKVLLYHVIPGRVPAGKVVKMKSATTAEGAKVQFSVRGRSAFVNESKIIKTDINCSNGIIHVINAVLIPPSMN
ncbi:MAG: fasciclin domain-containing protein [Actinobacteria bacterium]|nr:fasciclin domain-containing protein [Actinomycetota bacterium]